MSLGIRALRVVRGAYTAVAVEWKDIRKHYIALRKARRIDQDKVKGVPQPTISKLENNTNLGPQVETFVKAVEGLGLTLSQFFAQLENTPGVSPTPKTSQSDELGAAQNMNGVKHGASDSVRSQPEESDRRRTLFLDLAEVFARLAQEHEPGEQAPKTRVRRSVRS